MRKAAIPALIVVIFVAFGIILAAILITWAMNIISAMVHGSCWANMEKTMSDVKSRLNSLTPGESESKTIEMGDCVGGIVIFNWDEKTGYSTDVDRFKDIIEEECNINPGSYKSYMLILPWKTVKDDLQKDASLWGKIKNFFRPSYYISQYKTLKQSIRFLKPKCIGLGGEFQDASYYIPGAFSDQEFINEKNLEMCYVLSRGISATGSANPYHLKYVSDGKCPSFGGGSSGGAGAGG
jgi:uncharacterized membrane protein YgcG